MKIKNIDHFVITTSDLNACLEFYVGLLGMEHRETNGHHNLYFPNGKISIHTRQGEFQPAAQNPTYGSQDFCLIVDGYLKDVKSELEAKHAPIISDIVERHGSHGTIQSLYLRDHDGNLVELSSYQSDGLTVSNFCSHQHTNLYIPLLCCQVLTDGRVLHLEFHPSWRSAGE